MVNVEVSEALRKPRTHFVSRAKIAFPLPDRFHHPGKSPLTLEEPASNHGHFRTFRVLVVRGLGILVEIGINNAGETPNRAAS
jgi:hypothetical protein